MVQIIDLPQRYQDLLGQQIAQGLSRMYPSPEYNVQKNLQSNALSKFKSMLTPEDNMVDRSMKFLQATGGLQNQSELANLLLPQLNRQYMLDSLFRPQEQGLPQQQSSMQAQPMQGMQQNQIPPSQGNALQGLFGQGQQQNQGQSLAPQVSSPLNEALLMSGGDLGDIDQIRREIAGVPQAQIRADLQNIELEKALNLQKYAQASLPKDTTPQEMNDFLQMGENHKNLSPEKWFNETKKDYDKYINALSAFREENIPDWLSGWLRGGKYRQDSIDKMKEVAKPFQELGKEEVVRSKLASAGLSPTEIESVLHPLDKNIMKNFQDIAKMPSKTFHDELFTDLDPYENFKEKHPALYEQSTNKLSKMIADNVKNDTSLLLLRNKLRDDKGVDWRQFFDAFTRARNEYGFQPSVNQLQEMTELINPPRDSLVDIFSQPGKGWSRFIDWQRGAK